MTDTSHLENDSAYCITRFRDIGPDEQYYFLSSMYQLRNPIIAPCGVLSNTVEAAYTSSKFVDKRVQREIALLEDGKKARKRGRTLLRAGNKLNENWQEMRVPVMRNLIEQKFLNNPDLAKLLLATGDTLIVEGNTWGDTYWGQCPVGVGENHLGILLMERRELLRATGGLALGEQVKP